MKKKERKERLGDKTQKSTSKEDEKMGLKYWTKERGKEGGFLKKKKKERQTDSEKRKTETDKLREAYKRK